MHTGLPDTGDILEEELTVSFISVKILSSMWRLEQTRSRHAIGMKRPYNAFLEAITTFYDFVIDLNMQY